MLPESLRQPGDYLGEVVSTPREVYLQKQLHALAVSLYQAHQRGDKADAAALAAKMQELANELRSYNNADITAFDRLILATSDWVERSIDAIPGAIAALPRAIGGGLIQAAIPFAVLFLGYLWLTSSKRKNF
jgi:hypothetical protein